MSAPSLAANGWKRNPTGLMTPESGVLDSQKSNETDDRTAHDGVDPPLYSPVESTTRKTQVWSPLFPPASAAVPSPHPSSRGPPGAVVQSQTQQPHQQPREKPTAEWAEKSWMIVKKKEGKIWFNLDASEHYRRDPRGFTRQEWIWMGKCKGLGSKKVITKPETPKRETRSLAPVFTGVKKPKAKPMPKPAVVAPRRQREVRQPPAPIDSSTGAAPALVSPSTPKPSKASKPKDASVEKKPLDVEWWTITDYCPPTANLDRPPFSGDKKCMEVKWTGTAPNKFRLDDDQDRHLLHPAELLCAQSLRLYAAQYLTCKRRIFQAKVVALRNGKGFSKTHAQMACHVDVNKASKLWDRFNHVGWFADEHFRHLL